MVRARNKQTPKKMTTLLATFKNHADADLAVHELKNLGVPTSEIGVIALDTSAGGTGQVVSTTAASPMAPAGRAAGQAASDAASGAVSGAMLGAVGGLLVGVAALAIPGLGGLLVAGPIAAALGLTGVAATAATGAGIGIAAGGITSLVASLVKVGVPEVEANAVNDTIQSGGVVVSVKEQMGLDVRSALQAGNPIKITTVG